MKAGVQVQVDAAGWGSVGVCERVEVGITASV